VRGSGLVGRRTDFSVQLWLAEDMRGRLIALLAVAVATPALVAIFDVSITQAVIAGLVIAGVLRLGWAMIAGLAQPPMEPPDPGTLRKVKLVYQCTICGTEVRMTTAANDDPEPPRHCMEDMQLLTPVE